MVNDGIRMVEEGESLTDCDRPTGTGLVVASSSVNEDTRQ